MKKTNKQKIYKIVSRLEVIGENCAISKQNFCWFFLKYLKYLHQISPQKSEKYDLTFGTKIKVGLKKLGWGWCGSFWCCVGELWWLCILEILLRNNTVFSYQLNPTIGSSVKKISM